jgi:MoaA/NifB/PqqE/SkfB family radical SAM enzyme|tara:strand:+ start:1036 stop:2169 length:1134 start_codon:yes stop_codon:yes gene_type:complete
MSGMVQPCNQNIGYYLQDEDKKHYNVLNDDLKEIWHSKHRKQLLEDHANDVRHPACQQCWDCEDADIESTRQAFNKKLKDVEVLESQPRIMIVKPGNLCNNACRSCNAHTSSMWYKTDYALDNQGKTFKEYLNFFQRHKTAYSNNKLLEKRWAEWEDNIIFWDMYGGEPLIIPLFWKTLDQALASSTAKQKNFHLHTNGMVYKDDLVEKLSKFKGGHIGFSIDAVGAKNDYIRNGSKWEDILDNLRKYMDDCSKKSNVNMGVRATITPWNIYYYEENYDYFKKLGISGVGIWCDDKPHNDVRYLPNNIKDAVIEKLSLYDGGSEWNREFINIKKWLATTPDDHAQLQHSFMEFNNKVDQVRNEKFSDTFPEYSKLFI